MSTITVVKKDGFAAIAADSLTTWSSSKESANHVVNHQKILRLGEDFLGFTGSSSVILALRYHFSDASNEAYLDSVLDIFRTWTVLHEKLKNTYFLRPVEDEDDSVESMRINVLIANPYGIFSVGGHRDVQEFSRFYSHGAGNEYATGAMFAAYDSQRSALEIARLGVEAAAEFDDATGLPVLSHEIRLIDTPQDALPPA